MYIRTHNLLVRFVVVLLIMLWACMEQVVGNLCADHVEGRMCKRTYLVLIYVHG